MALSQPHIQRVSMLSLAFGLEWFALIDADARAEAHRIARRHRASHMAFPAEDASCVGLTSLAGRGTVVHSAALLAARRFPVGSVALVVSIGNDRWWLLGLHDGAIIARTDRVFASRADALEGIAGLLQAYPALKVIDDMAHAAALDDLVLPGCAPAELIALRRTFRGVQGWVGLTVAALGISLAAPWLSSQLSSTPFQQPPGADEARAGKLWRQAMDDVSQQHWVHGVAGTVAVLGDLQALPVRLSGWRLTEAQCVSAVPQWQCHASYLRDDDEATNDGFSSVAPARWRLDVTPLDGIRAHWQREADGTTLADVPLAVRSQNERLLFSRLQGIRTALPEVGISAPRAIDIPAPLDPSGQPIPPPAGFRPLQLRSVQIRAPLRSVSVLLPHCTHMGWRRVAMTVHEPLQPSLRVSQLVISLEGVLYEKV